MGDDVTTDEQINNAQNFLKHWQKVTSRPMTMRELDFAKAVRNDALEEAAQKAASWNTAMTDVLADEIRSMKD